MTAGLEDSGHTLFPGAHALVLERPGFRYRERSVGGAVACRWTSEVAPGRPHVQRVLPDGCVELVRQPDGTTLVFGPGTAWADVPLAPGAHYQGTRLLPGAARALLGVDVDALAGRVLDLTELDPLPLRHDVLAAAAARALTEDPSLRVAALARQLGISERQFRRRFRRSVGLGPGAFARVMRMQRAVRLALRGTSWARSAYAAGYADQAHLARELRALTGFAPTELLGPARR